MGKALLFMMFMWLGVSIAGGVYQGDTVSVVTTSLTVAIDEDDSTITVKSTDGFPDSGIITIKDERIGYASKTDTTFKSNLAQPVIRGQGDTTAVAHSVGELVRTIESSLLNESINYKLAVLTDSSGLIAFVAMPFALISLLATFFVLPLAFLGTDLQILTMLWGILSIAIIAVLAIALVGGRRV